MTRAVLAFLRTEAGGGVLLALAALCAVLVANSVLGPAYFALLKTPLSIDLGIWSMQASLKDWVKDGLMAIFFYVIGLELKREMTVGELSDHRTILMPVAAAVGGVLAPIALYTLLAGGAEPRGWPVPVATDIAFALAALAILAPRADPRLRLFLLTLAVIDDLIAIVLIAALFTTNLSLAPLISALLLLCLLWAAGRRWPLPVWIYPLAGLLTWALASQSGVHTSVMAVAAAMATPVRRGEDGARTIETLEHAIHPFSAYVVLPVFAFCAAGVSLSDLSLSGSAAGVSAGIALALALGKPLGVTLFTLGAARLAGLSPVFELRQIVSIGCLCGIGFTMSLFIGGLAFAGDESSETAARLGVLAGSLLSLFMAFLAFRLWPDRRG
jgi:NhaA family Na+:H+ antiporter